jgi:hypothetical protein
LKFRAFSANTVDGVTLSGFIQYKNKSKKEEIKKQNLKEREKLSKRSKALIHVGRRSEDSVFISNPAEAFHLDGKRFQNVANISTLNGMFS